MKFRLSTEDLEQIKLNYSNDTGAVGFAEENRFIGLPNYYVVILDDKQLTLVQMTMALMEKDQITIPLANVESIKVKGTIQKKAIIKTTHKTYKLVFKPFAVGKGEEQKNLLNRLANFTKAGTTELA